MTEVKEMVVTSSAKVSTGKDKIKFVRRTFDMYSAQVVAIYKLTGSQFRYDETGKAVEIYNNRQFTRGIVIPYFCKQLHINIDSLEEVEAMVQDSKKFCSDVYNCVRAEGLVRSDKLRGVKLYFEKNKAPIVWALDEYRCPILVNYEAQSKDWKRVRRLTLSKSDKMSHKLWATTDWFYAI